MKLYIKNMVCDRCKMVVEAEMKGMGYHPLSVELGEVALAEELAEPQLQALDARLRQLGFERIDDKKSRLIDRVKTLILELVHQHDGKLKTNLSDYLSQHLHYDYNYVSNLFSEVEGTTIEKHFIAHKIERVKELLVYDELNLSEIAFKLHYSSVAHLSSQFKKVTGLTPSHFKNIRSQRRKPLDEV